MRKLLVALVACAAIVPLAAGLTGSASATSASLFARGRFQPSGTLVVDPATVVPRSALPKHVPAAIVPGPGSNGCSDKSRTNVRANQECTAQSAPGYQGRGESQNETAVAVNPLNPLNVLISQNDYRRGDGNCGVDWSLDGGRTWGSETAPTGFGYPVLDNGGVRHYWTTGGDTSVGFDSSGEAYLMCQVFDRGFPTDETGPNAAFGASGFAIFRSADGGASWSFPGDYVVTTPGAEGDSHVIVHDKEYMTIDTNPDSPYRDRIYVSWTLYKDDGTNAIYLNYSTDHGATWKSSGAISGADSGLCPLNNYSDGDDEGGGDLPEGTGKCTNDQFSDPFVAPNGDLYVTFVNGNNCNGFKPKKCQLPKNDNHFQILLVKSTDGGKTFSPPVKVGDYYELPDCLTYTGQDAGRACVPTAPLSPISVFRATNYPSGVALSNSKIVIDYGSYINEHSNPSLGNCAPAGFSDDTGGSLYSQVGVPGGCNNDIVRSVSTDGGKTFTGTTTPVDKLPSVGGTKQDQWWQWTAANPNDQAVATFFDRQYGSDMATGYMDISLVTGDGVSRRVTDTSMPPSNEFPTSDGYSLFIGDYIGLAVGSDGIAHPAWPDTRNPIYTFDLSGDPRQLIPAGYGADIYTARVKS
jgi:hypothetical protein